MAGDRRARVRTSRVMGRRFERSTLAAGLRFSTIPPQVGLAGAPPKSAVTPRAPPARAIFLLGPCPRSRGGGHRVRNFLASSGGGGRGATATSSRDRGGVMDAH